MFSLMKKDAGNRISQWRFQRSDRNHRKHLEGDDFQSVRPACYCRFLLNIPLLFFPHNKTSNRTQNLHNYPPVRGLVSQQIPEKSDDISRVHQSDSHAITFLSLLLKYLVIQHASSSFSPNESIETEKQTSV